MATEASPPMADKNTWSGGSVAKPIHVIGLEADELASVKTLVSLLRHADPTVRELCRQALLYLEDLASQRGGPDAGLRNTAG